MRVELLTRELEAGPGESVLTRLRVHNDGPTSASYSLCVHGMGGEGEVVPIGGDPLPAGASTEVDVALTVPETFGYGSHLVALEVRSDHRGEAPLLTDLTVNVGTLDRVVTRITPSVIRRGRRAGFVVEVLNRRSVPTDVALSGSGPELHVRIFKPSIHLRPGEVRRIRGKVRGPRRVVGDSVQRVLTVEARSSSAPSYATASFQQRAVIPRPVRAGLLAMSLIVVWALIAGAAVLWWSHRENTSKTGAATTTAVAGSTGSTPGATGTGGSTPAGSPGAGQEGGQAGGGGQGGSGQAGGGTAGGQAAPTATIVRGLVKAGGTGADDNVLVTLTPTTPDAAAAAPAASALRAVAGGPGDALRLPAHAESGGDSGDAVKRWPARYATYDTSPLSNLRTISVLTQNSDRDGSFQFQGVPLRRTYEVSFAKPGFTTQSFIVATKADGKPVELDVELKPGDGALAGSIVGSGGGVGGAHLTITDGTLTFQTTSSTDAATRGRWSVEKLSTPGEYTVTVTKEGLGTEVLQVHLGAAEERRDLVVHMSSGVGSISGTVGIGDRPLGGVTLTATAGDVTATTTSLTEGAKGTYNFPALKLGETYTVTAAAEGYITQTQRITLSGNHPGVDFTMVSTTATVVGRVLSNNPAVGPEPVPLANAAITLAANGLEVHASSAADGDAGAFHLDDLPPGTYLLTVSRYDHTPRSQTVTVIAGQQLHVGIIVLDFHGREQLQPTGSLVIRTFDTFGREVNGATVQLVDNGGRLPTVSKTMADNANTVEFTAVPIAVYRVVVSKATFQPSVISHLSMGLGPVERTVTLFKYGSARGTVVDALGGYTTTPLLDSLGHPVYEAAGELVYFDPTLKIDLATIVPALSCFTPVASGPCYSPVEAYHDTTGKLVVKYVDSGTQLAVYVRDADGNNVPEQQLTPAVESIGKVQLADYELLLYRLDGSNRTCMTALEVVAGTLPDTEGRILWKVDPLLQLQSATYILRFSPAPGDAGSPCAGHGRLPPGYAPIPLPDSPGDVAQFTIPPGLDQQVVVPPIAVAPYPKITGTVLVPHVATDGTTTFDNFASAQSAGLAVSIECPGGATAQATLVDNNGAVGFSLTPQQVAAIAGLPIDLRGSLPSCTLRAAYTAPSAYIPAQLTLAWHVGFPQDLSTTPPTAIPSPSPDLDIRVALVEDPTIVAGTLRWRDLGATGSEETSYPLTPSAVAVPAAIVGYQPATSGDPTPITADLTQAADGYGQWAFTADGARQVIGTATYQFSSAHATDGSATVTADKDGWTMTAGANTEVVRPTGASSADVYLLPHPGSLTGQIDVTSYRPRALVDADISLVPTPPETCDGTITVAATFTKNPACAGTWNLEYGGGQSSVLPRTGPTSQRVLVNPDQQSVAATVGFVDLGEVKVVLEDQVHRAITDQNVSVTLSPNSPPTLWPGPADVSAYHPGTTDPDKGVVRFTRIPVNSSSPLTAVDYTLNVDAPGYQTDQAAFTLVDVTNPAAPITTPGLGVSVFPIPIAAGRRYEVHMTVPSQATVTGTVDGLLTPPGYTPEQTESLTLGTQLTVQAVRTTDGQSYDAIPDPDGTTYKLVVPVGSYVITYSAVDYVSQTVALDLGPGDVVRRDVRLLLQGGEVRLTATTAETGGSPVDGAKLQLFWGSVTGVPPASGESFSGITVNGTVDVTAVTPGNYTLVVRNLDPLSGRDLNFPVMGSITITRPPGAALSLRVIMPLVDGSIAGTVSAVNSLGHSVAMPAGATVDRAYHAPGTDVNTAGGEAIMVSPPAVQLPLDETTAGAGAAYAFQRLAYGVHTLSFSAAGGYTQPADDDVVVAGAVTGRDYTYRANDVTVTVRLEDASGAAVTGADVSLVPPGTGKPQPITMFPTATDGDYSATGVPPELDQYTLSIGGKNVGKFSQPVTIPPSAQTVDLGTIVVSRPADINGTLQRQDTQAGPPTKFAGATVELVDPSKPPESQVVDSTTTAANGSFTLQAATTGTYTVRAMPPGYRPATVSVNVTSVGANANFNAGTLTVLKWASVTYTVPAAVTVTVSPSAGTTSSSPGSFVFGELDPDTTYTFTATGTGYDTQTEQLNPDIGVDYSKSFTWRQVTLQFFGGTPTSVAVTRGGSPVSISPAIVSGSLVYRLWTTASYVFTASGSGLVTESQSLAAGTADVTVPFTWNSMIVTLTGTGSTIDTALTVGLPAGATGSARVTKNSTTLFTVTGLAQQLTYVVTVSGTGLDTQSRSIGPVTGDLQATFAWGTASGSVDNAQPSTTVYVCTVSRCDSAAKSLRPGVDINGKTGSFTFTGLKPGSYVIGAVRSDGTYGEQAFTINADGSLTPTGPYPITLTPPTTTTTSTTTTVPPTTTTTVPPTTTTTVPPTTTTTTSTTTTTTSTTTTTTVA